MKILLKDRMTDEELEDSIWNVCAVEIPSLSKIWAKVGGNRNLCFAKVKEMIERYDLKKTDEGNYVRVDSTKRYEFDFGFEFQRRMLLLSRKVIKETKYPMFKRIGVYKTSRFVHLGRESKTVTDIDKKGEYKPRTKEVKTNFDNMSFYYTALMIYTARTNFQRALNILNARESKRRIENCEKALDSHFKILLSENPRESKAIRQYFKHKIYHVDNFRV